MSRGDRQVRTLTLSSGVFILVIFLLFLNVSSQVNGEQPILSTRLSSNSINHNNGEKQPTTSTVFSFESSDTPPRKLIQERKVLGREFYSPPEGYLSRIKVALLVSTIAKYENSVEELPLLQILLRSFFATLTEYDVSNFEYRFYIGFDENDKIYDSEENIAKLSNYFNTHIQKFKEKLCGEQNNQQSTISECNRVKQDIQIDIQFFRMRETKGAPTWVWNTLANYAYFEHFDYFYQLNDDVEIQTSNWAAEFISQLVKQSNIFAEKFGIAPLLLQHIQVNPRSFLPHASSYIQYYNNHHSHLNNNNDDDNNETTALYYISDFGDKELIRRKVSELRYMARKGGFGVTGAHDNNIIPERLMYFITQGFVHRSHMEIFNNVMYPNTFPNWFMDNWIQEVYHPFCFPLASQSILNVNPYGSPRYDIRMKDKQFGKEMWEGCYQLFHYFSTHLQRNDLEWICNIPDQGESSMKHWNFQSVPISFSGYIPHHGASPLLSSVSSPLLQYIEYHHPLTDDDIIHDADSNHDDVHDKHDDDGSLNRKLSDEVNEIAKREKVMMITFVDRFHVKNVLEFWMNQLIQINMTNYLVIALDRPSYVILNARNVNCYYQPDLSIDKFTSYYSGVDNVIVNITNHYIYEILMNGVSPIVSFHSATHLPIDHSTLQRFLKDMFEFDMQFERFDSVQGTSSLESHYHLPIQLSELKSMFIRSNIKNIKFFQKLTRFGTQYPHLLLYSFRYILDQLIYSVRIRLL